MEKNNEISMEQLRKIAQSDAARQLMAMLDTNTVGSIRQNAQAGNMDDAQKALSTFLSDPKAQALLKQLEEQGHG